MMPGITPHISVLIPTCDRPDDLRRCLESLANVAYPAWDVLVVDQSDDVRMQALVESYAHRLPQLAYRRIDQKGACHARNVGFQMVDGNIVALLDDDCTVEANWLMQVASAFERHPRAALIMGTVRSAPHDPSQCYIPVFEVSEEQT